MAHFAILCPDEAGHVLSMGPIGKELVRRGHRVTLLGQSRAAHFAEQLDLSFRAIDELDDIPDRNTFFLDMVFGIFRAQEHVGLREWLHWLAQGILDIVPPILRELQVDGVIVDHTVTAGGTAAELAGVPFVTVNSALLWHEEPTVPPSYTSWRYSHSPWALLRNRLGFAGWHWFTAPTMKLLNRYRKRAGLPAFHRIDDTFSSLAQISQLCPGFDFPRNTLPENFHYIGSLTTDRKVSDNSGFPWHVIEDRPFALASLGTVSDPANLSVFPRILEAFAGIDTQLVLSLGRWEKDDEDDPREQLGSIPDNALVVDFVPQLALLDKASLLITHAGVNTVLEALCRGVPMVAMPRSADQPGMATRIAYAGVGLLGSFRHSSARQIREMVKRVLDEPSFRQRAQELKQVMIAAGGLRRAADIAELALTTGRPVTREQVAAMSRETEVPAPTT